ncbi:MAG TPA: hypothetical protein ENJ31_03005 [Anaerolineae bacterium]|nr:hypothetical protein [Anaerolineae bacterium]
MMGLLRRLAFYLGLIVGLVTVAAAGTVALTYLLTGKLVSLNLAEGKATVTLMTPDEIIALIRSQMESGKAPVDIEIEGGDQNGAI